ncbi:unnamed protein product [Brassicogethes aeneus]|uniref:CWH43-like N-terminal domain-containing protein n=1 Tax=Brassicogethes aeneus TaxID=1431903 RepID=A0A9P0B6V7_BRAAE|nr:unnamed protein product [Brassicogethes aeneus]
MVPKNCEMEINTKSNKTNDPLIVHYKLSFKNLCLLSLAFPLVSLLVCLITGYIFQPNDIHETHCRVYNIIPSISAITGISPQIYLWRISVAFHIGPRFIIAAVYRAYQLNLINPTAPYQAKNSAQRWLNISFWLEIIESSSFCGVTYISNRENYPVHEKLFITFMLSSLSHMIACIVATSKVAMTRNNYKSVQKGIKFKTKLLIVSLVSAAGLVGFFMEHRFFCHRMAFSMFALCEYIIAIANMAFHISIILDFPTEHLVVARGISGSIKID